MCALKFEAIAADIDVSSKVIEVNNNAKRNFNDVDPETGCCRSLHAKLDKVRRKRNKIVWPT
jgi:hypothetical protein